MLVDIKVDPHYNSQVVAGELEAYCGLKDPTVYWGARTIRGKISRRKLHELRKYAGVKGVRKSDNRRIVSGIAPVLRPSRYNLSLCDVTKVLTDEELKRLNDDLAHLADQRRWTPPNNLIVR